MAVRHDQLHHLGHRTREQLRVPNLAQQRGVTQEHEITGKALLEQSTFRRNHQACGAEYPTGEGQVGEDVE